MSDVQRKLASIRKIDAIQPIEGADAIEVAVLGGWKVVTKKGEYKPGDLAVYCEIDCWIPTEIAPFLSKGKEPRVYEGIKGEKLRTVKLRGQISQGLLLSLDVLQSNTGVNYDVDFKEGDDVTALLGIIKWEPVLPANLAGQVKGLFPSFIRKTDQERCQNIVSEILIDNADSEYELTMKLDGSSCTIFMKDGELGVCSRNLELKINDENKDNAMVRVLFDTGLNVALAKLGRNIAIQGEIMGPGIQGNREGFKEPKFFVFDMYDIDNGEYFTPGERAIVFGQLQAMCPTLNHVPILAHRANLKDTLGIITVEQLLKFAEGPSINHQVREGIVFKRLDGKFSFKAISNKFLEKEKD